MDEKCIRCKENKSTKETLSITDTHGNTVDVPLCDECLEKIRTFILR